MRARYGKQTCYFFWPYIETLYSELNGTVNGPTWFSEPFHFNKGVFQGDPLSLIIF